VEEMKTAVLRNHCDHSRALKQKFCGGKKGLVNYIHGLQNRGYSIMFEAEGEFIACGSQ
jgi:hypothetical protein